MDGLDGTIQLGRPAQLFERQIRFAVQQGLQLLAVVHPDIGPPPAAVIPTGDITGLAALLQELLDQAHRNPVAVGNFFAGTFVLIIGRQNALP
jgi:hypothetical protein